MPKPHWLKKNVARNGRYENVQAILNTCGLHTVCEEAICPNRGECYSRGTATFLVLGDRCTRSCRFCALEHDNLLPPDPAEPARVAEAAVKLGLNYVVITSVTRDDLPDGGANHFAETIGEIRRKSPYTRIEVLIPDFQGSEDELTIVVKAHPDVIGHNVETVPRLYPDVRPGADYYRSLKLIKRIYEIDSSVVIKSGLMLGLGETPDEIRRVLTDLSEVNCSVLTLGQYLQPSKELLPVRKYIPPHEFDNWKDIALNMDFRAVASGPFVRSSYHAEEHFDSINRTG